MTGTLVSEPTVVGRAAARVLIVDDDEGPRKTLEYVLGEMWPVDAAKSVAEAAALVRTNSYGVIIMDIRMPGTDGLQGLTEVRKIDPSVGVIMLTSYNDLEPAQKAIALGANRYLTKPWKTADIRHVVQTEIARTNVRRAEQAAVAGLRAKISALEQRLEDAAKGVAYSEATAGVIHDLCSPLLAAIGHASLVMDAVRKLDEKFPNQLREVFEHTQVIDRCAETCYQLANSWRLSTKEHENVKRLSLGPILRNLHETIFTANPALSIVCDPHAEVNGVEIEVHRIFQNLIKNAFESEAAHVLVKVQLGGDKVRCEVADDGPGIPEEMRRTVFKARTPSTKAEGSGHGLSIVRHLVRMQGGEITFTTKEKEGTTFHIEFPAAV